jgi:hypothetical protein
MQVAMQYRFALHIANQWHFLTLLDRTIQPQRVIVGVKYVTGSDRALAKLARLVKKADTLMTVEFWSLARVVMRG